jgi:hypothetical protein
MGRPCERLLAVAVQLLGIESKAERDLDARAECLGVAYENSSATEKHQD